MKFNKKKVLIGAGFLLVILAILFWSYISTAIGITGNSVKVIG